ncbi:hypothetical protein LINPERPRIM_LOCUS15931 [Linum perenne]
MPATSLSFHTLSPFSSARLSSRIDDLDNEMEKKLLTAIEGNFKLRQIDHLIFGISKEESKKFIVVAFIQTRRLNLADVLFDRVVKGSATMIAANVVESVLYFSSIQNGVPRERREVKEKDTIATREVEKADGERLRSSGRSNRDNDVYDCVGKLIQLPSTQQAMIHDQNELLDGSLRMLDMCNTAKDALSQMKESVAELQSAIRRRQSDLVAETKRYLNSRKTVKKAIQKALKGMETNKSTSSNNMLIETESVVVEVLGSLLSFISQSNSKSNSWSLVSKIMAAKKNEVSANEFVEVDACLKTSKSTEEIQAHLKNLQPCIQDLEEGVESLFRCLIKTRSSILNILS